VQRRSVVIGHLFLMCCRHHVPFGNVLPAKLAILNASTNFDEIGQFTKLLFLPHHLIVLFLITILRVLYRGNVSLQAAHIDVNLAQGAVPNICGRSCCIARILCTQCEALLECAPHHLRQSLSLLLKASLAANSCGRHCLLRLQQDW